MVPAGQPPDLMEPQAPGLAPQLYNANYGYQTVMQSVPVSGGLQIKETTLIADVRAGQNEWMITLSPPTRADNPGTIPWQSSFDGTTTPPTSGANFSAPELPTLGLQVLLRFASGGAAFTTRFDYPYNGGVFGVSCEMLNLDVAPKPGQTPITYATPADLPFLGASMTEGAPANSMPLRWTDIAASVAANSAAATFWPVRPYARSLDIYANGSANAVLTLEWFNASAGQVLPTLEIVASATGTFTARGLDVPPSAQGLAISNSGAAVASTVPVWEISFA